MDTKERVYKFSLSILKLMDIFPKDTSSQVISKQLIRSATSIGANIIEAKGSSSRKDFTNFFHHALKSANETKYWLDLTRDANKVDKSLIDPLVKEVDEIRRILSSSILTLKGKK